MLCLFVLVTLSNCAHSNRWLEQGDMEYEEKNYEKAIQYYQKELQSDLKTKGENDPEIADDLHRIGITWRIKGDPEKAIEYHEKAIAVKLKSFDESHPVIAELWNDLGVALLYKGETDRAIEVLQKALKSIKNKTEGNSFSGDAIWIHHGTTFIPMDFPQDSRRNIGLTSIWLNLSMAWVEKGEMEKAQGYFEKALNLAKQTDNLETIEWMEHLIIELNK